MQIHCPAFMYNEEYRQSVIRKALLLGFSCEEYTREEVVNRHVSPVQFKSVTRYRFWFDGMPRTDYGSVYSAAFDYMRLLGIPDNIIGAYRG